MATKKGAPRRSDTSPLAGLKPAHGPAREKVWNTRPGSIDAELNAEWRQPVGGPAQMPDNAATPGTRIAAQVDAKRPEPPGGARDEAAGNADRRPAAQLAGGRPWRTR